MDSRKESIHNFLHSDPLYNAFKKYSREDIWAIGLYNPISLSLSPEERVERFFQDGYVADANESWAKTVGYDSWEEVLRLPIETFLPQSSEKHLEQIRKVAEADFQIEDIVTEGYSKVNKSVYYHLTNFRPFLEGNQVVAVWGNSQSITAQKLAESKIEEIDFRAKTLAKLANGWETWFDPDHVIKYISPAVEKITGYTRHQFVVKPSLINEIVVQEDRRLWKEFNRNIPHMGENENKVWYRIQLQDGQIRWIESKSQIILDMNGVLKGTLVYSRDVTEIVQIEKALSKSKEFNRSVLESVQDHVAVISRSGDILSANNCWEEFTQTTNHAFLHMEVGLNYLQILEKSVSSHQLSETDQKTAYQVLKGIRGILDGQSDRFILEYSIIDGEHEQRWFEIHIRPSVGKKGGVIVAHKEVSPEKRLNLRLKESAAELKELKKQLGSVSGYPVKEIKPLLNQQDIIGESASLKYVLYRVADVAPTDTPVLVMGETGTGKELIAQAIHRESSRNDKPLLTINCAALPAGLIESELFGHEKGAFTGADRQRKGCFQLADGGTLFLDEVSEIPVELQAKLLRVLENGEVQPVGSSRFKRTDVRVIAATNRNLNEEVANGNFREDLLYRINVFPITIPPLRQRKEDIPLLAQWFIKRFNRKMRKNVSIINQDKLKRLQLYDWPGNVRELENVIERSIIISKTSALDFDEEFIGERVGSRRNGSSRLFDMERAHILQILDRSDWKIEGTNGAAEILGLPPSTLRGRMKKLSITRVSNRKTSSAEAEVSGLPGLYRQHESVFY